MRKRGRENGDVNRFPPQEVMDVKTGIVLILAAYTKLMSRRMFQSVVGNIRPYLQKSNRFVEFKSFQYASGIGTG
jgi:hypothetical protein